MPQPSRRHGLDPLPARIPPLPGGGGGGAPAAPGRDEFAGDAPSASPEPTPSSARRPGRPSYRSVESQLDADCRRFLELTAFQIKLRTETPFDRSALLRGILRAVLNSDIDFAGECETEQDVTDLLREHLHRGGG